MPENLSPEISSIRILAELLKGIVTLNPKP